MKLFCGKPLIYWSIKVALEANLGPVCVSTDSKEIREYAISLGCIAPFLRPIDLATDSTPTEPVLAHAYQYFKDAEFDYKYLVLLQPTSPFRVLDDLLEAKRIMAEDSECTAVFSVREAIANQNPYWMLVQDAETKRVQKFTGGSLSEMAARRQDLPKCYIRNDYVYFFKSSNLFDPTPSLYGANPKILISNESRIDIDLNTEGDWILGEAVFSIKNN
jgi:CMP-N-acetylneuraminic acid synthetase